jgi:hypothetical protein
VRDAIIAEECLIDQWYKKNDPTVTMTAKLIKRSRLFSLKTCARGGVGEKNSVRPKKIIADVIIDPDVIRSGEERFSASIFSELIV